MDSNEIMKIALKTYGTDAQLIKTIEELSELISALSRELNRIPSNVTEEMADVEIMLAQIKMALHIDGEKLEEIKNRKLTRVAERMGLNE